MNGIRAVKHAVEAQPNMELFQRTELVTPKLKVVTLHDRGAGVINYGKIPTMGIT